MSQSSHFGISITSKNLYLRRYVILALQQHWYIRLQRSFSININKSCIQRTSSEGEKKVSRAQRHFTINLAFTMSSADLQNQLTTAETRTDSEASITRASTDTTTSLSSALRTSSLYFKNNQVTGWSRSSCRDGIPSGIVYVSCCGLSQAILPKQKLICPVCCKLVPSTK